jgi:hypothetical protein
MQLVQIVNLTEAELKNVPAMILQLRTEAIAGWIEMKGRNPCRTVRRQNKWKGHRRGANRRPGSVVAGKQNYTALGFTEVTGGDRRKEDPQEGRDANWEKKGMKIRRRGGRRIVCVMSKHSNTDLLPNPTSFFIFQNIRFEPPTLILFHEIHSTNIWTSDREHN